MTRIGLDAMGGDNAPEAVLEGAIRAVERGFIEARDISLVGQKERLVEILRDHFDCTLDFDLVHADQVVDMNDHPVEALRRKRDSSISVGIKLHKKGHVDAMISAGNTGAMVAAGTLALGHLKGIKRSGIAVLFHSLSGACTLIDVGANIHCKPTHLFQYGWMAANYMQCLLGVENPRVAMMNIGAESDKGTSLVKETRQLFQESPLNFIGNIEGNDVFSGKCDVLVCDGFVGNVILKVSEGLGAYMFEALRGDMVKMAEDSNEKAVWQRILQDLYLKIDYAEYGGAPLLGVNGNVYICHGRSDAKAISNAIKVACLNVEKRVNEHIIAGLVS